MLTKESIMKKAGFCKSGNIKLGQGVYTFSKLMGDEDYYNGAVYEYMHNIAADIISLKGSCGHYCKGCKGACYVKKSYRYPSVIRGHAIRTYAMRLDLQAVFNHLNNQLDRAKKKPAIVRVNQSGEIESAEEVRGWIDLAARHPYTQVYLYTKAYDIVLPVLLEYYNGGGIPSNFTVLISVWHEYGADIYKKVAYMDCIKAFVYDDGYDYASINIKPNTYCKAYQDGKLNHDITCDKCRKCFNRLDSCKVIFCEEH